MIIMDKKIIMDKDRIILIRNELTSVEEWTKLFNSLTFAEGMAMAKATEIFSKRYLSPLTKE